ncbi:MAG: hypothetical protein ACJARP_000693 [Vicingaceae bacterium]|jgi:hypothetical protein
MKYIALIICFLFTQLTSNAQIYFSEALNIEVTEGAEQIEHPFTGGFNNAQFSEIDLNQDGVMDLIVTDRFLNTVKPYVNDGIADSVSYTYAPEYSAKFPDMDRVLITRDYNDDGKMDLFVTGNSIFLYENTSTPSGGLSFQLVDKMRTKNNSTTTNQSILNPNAVNYPAIVDLEGDKDVDIIYRSSVRTLDYHRNLSIDQNNNFDPIYERRNTCWGFIRFIFSKQTSVLDSILFQDCRFDTRGERLKRPDLVKRNKHAEGLSTTALDIDKNGSMDLVTSDIASYQMRVLLNADSGASQTKVSSEIFKIIDSFPNYDVPVHLLYATAYFIDVNNDGLKDFIAASSHSNTEFTGPHAKEEIWLYENISTNNGYRFQLKTKTFLRNKTLDFGRKSKPTFIDYNKDGLKDLLVGSGGYLDFADSTLFTDALALLENIGTKNTPKYRLVNRDYLEISTLNFGFTPTYFANSSPVVGDLDGDGDEDFLLVQRNQKVYWFEDTASAGNIASFKFHSTPYQGIKETESADLFDINNDGLVDLITSRDNFIQYFPNFGTAQSPLFNLQLDSIVWQNGDTLRYHVEGNPNYSFFKIGDSLAVDNTLNQDNNSRVALIVTNIDTLNSFIDCFNTSARGAGSNQYNELNTTATLNFFNRSWELKRNDTRVENIFLFKDKGINQFYAGGANNTTFRVNNVSDSLQPILETNLQTEEIFMSHFGESMFIDGADINGDSIVDLVVGLSTGGLKIVYGSNVNSVNEISNKSKVSITFKIFPNPTKGILNIELSEFSGNLLTTIEIRDLSGKLVLTGQLKTRRQQLNIASLSKGVYFISIRNRNEMQTRKLILQP